MTVQYSFKLLRAGTFKLDGGSMFGLIPRSVWSKSVPTDDKGRITVAHNCLLLERVGEAPALLAPEPGKPAPFSPKRILIEAGSGDKLDPKMRDVFELEMNPATGKSLCIEDKVREAGVKPEDIDAVIVSHLHFDHAGGLTRLARSGETPTWPVPPNDDGGGGSSQTKGNVLTFPNARVIVQQREWSDAIANRSVMTKTYYPDHLHPIRDKLMLVDSPRPYVTGLTPDRDELPRTSVEQRETEVFPGVSVFLVPGHTWGQQAIKFTDDLGRTIVFTPDVMPTAAHLGSAYSLAYDVEPYTSMLSRRWLLTEAAARGWILHLDHEPAHPLVSVKPSAKGWFDLTPVSGTPTL